MARVSGYLHQSSSARSASEESLPRRFWHRFPWLLVGLAAAMVAAVIVAGFEEGLQSATAVAMFLPWLLSRVGLDPAFGSGPMSTVAQDLLSLTIYFAFAVAFVL
jgi:Mg/Co/Ni transporter MgtE